MPEWTEFSLQPVADVSALEAASCEIALEQNIDISDPFPFIVEGSGSEIQLHVLNHSWPITNPEGPQPWRFTGTKKSVILIDFYAQDAAGIQTHHNQSSHIHAAPRAENISGHLDGFTTIESVRLFLPAS